VPGAGGLTVKLGGRVSQVRTVAAVGSGVWSDLDARVQLASSGGALLVARAVGSGTAELLADIAPLSNAALARRDDAALGLALAGPTARPVVFLESVHGFAPSGLAAIPARWRWFLIGLVAAAALLAAARARRLGDPDPPALPAPPPRAAYVAALAGLLARVRDRAAATERLRAAAVATVRRRAQLGPRAGESQLRDAALAQGLTPELARALTEVPGDDRQLLDLGRAVAALGIAAHTAADLRAAPDAPTGGGSR
jgi:hypothetical protein